MTPEQQRIAIAKVCGWTAEQDSNGYWRAVHKSTGNAVELWLSERNVWSVGIPDYLDDLNACHEMEELLDEGQKERFVFWINHLHPFADIHYSEKKKDIQREVFSLVHATAAQRAKAFLLTLGLWQFTPTQPQ
jgi:hypothetical protein